MKSKHRSEKKKPTRVATRRLSKTEEHSISKRVAILNSELLGLQMGWVDVSAQNPESVLKWASKCPLCINASSRIDRTNLTFLVATEEQDMFQQIVDEHIRKIHGVTEVNFRPIVKWNRPFLTNIDLSASKSIKPPCNMQPFCQGCPENPKYAGKLWSSKIRHQ